MRGACFYNCLLLVQYNIPTQQVSSLTHSELVLLNRVPLSCRYVKLSSPNLNYIIIIGAAILYATVVLYVYSVNDKSQRQIQTIICNVSNICTIVNALLCTSLQIRQWSFSVGYTLCFAVILTKTWRIYYIFNNPTTKKKVSFVNYSATAKYFVYF